MKVLQIGKRERRAVGLSVLLHASLAPLFAVAVVGTAAMVPEDKESQVGIMTIAIHHRAAPAPAPAPPKPEQSLAPSPAPLAVRRQSIALPKLAAAHRVTGAHAERKVAIIEHMDTPSPMPTTSQAPTPPTSAPVSAVQKPVSGAASSASAAPVATPEPNASAEVIASAVAPIGGWGADFHAPIVLDDTAFQDLRTKYHGAVAHIEVDEDGHATSVTVAGKGLDPDTLADLQKHLMTMRYVPAERNGLRCAGAFELHV